MPRHRFRYTQEEDEPHKCMYTITCNGDVVETKTFYPLIQTANDLQKWMSAVMEKHNKTCEGE